MAQIVSPSRSLLVDKKSPVGSDFSKNLRDVSVTPPSEITEHLIFDSPQPQQKRTKIPQRRPGPKNPKYGIPPAQWPDVLRRADQGESLRQLAKEYHVSYQTIWRVLHAIRKQQHGGEA